MERRGVLSRSIDREAQAKARRKKINDVSKSARDKLYREERAKHENTNDIADLHRLGLIDDSEVNPAQHCIDRLQNGGELKIEILMALCSIVSSSKSRQMAIRHEKMGAVEIIRRAIEFDVARPVKVSCFYALADMHESNPTIGSGEYIATKSMLFCDPERVEDAELVMHISRVLLAENYTRGAMELAVRWNEEMFYSEVIDAKVSLRPFCLGNACLAYAYADFLIPTEGVAVLTAAFIGLEYDSVRTSICFALKKHFALLDEFGDLRLAIKDSAAVFAFAHKEDGYVHEARLREACLVLLASDERIGGKDVDCEMLVDVLHFNHRRMDYLCAGLQIVAHLLEKEEAPTWLYGVGVANLCAQIFAMQDEQSKYWSATVLRLINVKFPVRNILVETDVYDCVVLDADGFDKEVADVCQSLLKEILCY